LHTLALKSLFAVWPSLPGRIFLPLPWLAALACAGVLLDRLLGEPRRAHPLVGFGWYANRLEHRLNRDRQADIAAASSRGRALAHRLTGLAAWALAVLPPVALAAVLILRLPFALACTLHALLLWFALGARSLHDHLRPIAQALAQGELVQARNLTARIVTRDTANADAGALARAAVESALENGNDAIFATLFWFMLAGGPGALAFRLLNTLDAMWGYRTPRLLYFGWAAARLDDLANWLPARLTAATYALCGNWRQALWCWRTQAPAWDSPNAGPVMASGAGSLGVLLGGAARYHGIDEARPALGTGPAPVAEDILRALRLLRHSLMLWLGSLVTVAALLGAGALAATSLSAHAATPAAAPEVTPLSVIDDSGATVNLAGPARRIVSLAPHLTELVFAAGAGDKLVGVVSYSDYPEAAQKIPRVGDNRALDLERIVALKPDLILVWRHANVQQQLDALRGLQIPLYLSAPHKVDDVATTLEKLGHLLGTETVAHQAAQDYRRKIALLRARYAQQTPVSVFYQVWDNPLMTLNDEHWISDAVTLCGGRNVFGQLAPLVPTVSTEAVLASNPDVILTSGAGATRSAQKLPGLDRWQAWPKLTAVAHGNLFVLDGDLIDRPTPRLADGAAELCRDLELARQRLR